MDIISFFLPIRQNSKRIKNKSFKRINKFKYGLTEIKINQFKKIKKYFTNGSKNYELEFVVSSDSRKIENYVKKFNWIKFHKRTKKLSTDNSLDKLIQKIPEICSGNIILWTHVTSPLFRHWDYIDFIKKFLKNKKNKSAFTGTPINSFIFNNSKKKWISHQRRKNRMWPRTQDLDKIFEVNSAAFIAYKSVYKRYKDRLDSKPLPIVIDKKKSLDIDNKKDFTLFKNILKKTNEIL